MKISFNLLIVILLLLFLTSCQYKPERFLDNIYPANWRHEFNFELSKCDDEKILFISEYINKYPNVDSSFFYSDCYSITDLIYKRLEKQNSSINRSKLIDLFKEDYKIVINYKQKYSYKNNDTIVTGVRHNIKIRYSGKKNIKPYKPFMEFEWQYDNQRKIWILDWTGIWFDNSGSAS